MIFLKVALWLPLNIFAATWLSKIKDEELKSHVRDIHVMVRNRSNIRKAGETRKKLI